MNSMPCQNPSIAIEFDLQVDEARIITVKAYAVLAQTKLKDYTYYKVEGEDSGRTSESHPRTPHIAS
jgi:hypothetical protein